MRHRRRVTIAAAVVAMPLLAAAPAAAVEEGCVINNHDKVCIENVSWYNENIHVAATNGFVPADDSITTSYCYRLWGGFTDYANRDLVAYRVGSDQTPHADYLQFHDTYDVVTYRGRSNKVRSVQHVDTVTKTYLRVGAIGCEFEGALPLYYATDD